MPRLDGQHPGKLPSESIRIVVELHASILPKNVKKMSLSRNQCHNTVINAEIILGWERCYYYLGAGERK